MRARYVLILMFLSISTGVIALLLTADTSFRPHPGSREYDLYCLQKVASGIITVISVVIFYILYDYYKIVKEEEFTVQALTPVNINKTFSGNGVRCPKCGSSNAIIQTNKIFCLDCGEISKMVIKNEKICSN